MKRKKPERYKLIEFGYLPLSRLIRKKLQERSMNRTSLFQMMGWSITYGDQVLLGHRFPSQKFWIAMGVFFGWIHKKDGSIMNDAEGIKKTFAYFEGTETHSSSKEIGETLLARDMRRKLARRKKSTTRKRIKKKEQA